MKTSRTSRILQPSRRLMLLALLATLLGAARNVPAAAPASSPAVQNLVQKASSLELQGKIDLARLTWQQVLLLDPANPEALAGEARAARRDNHAGPSSTRVEAAPLAGQLNQASALAAAGQYAQAIELYRRVFAVTPPHADDALALYQAEAALDDSRPQAIAGLRALAAKYPTDSRYRIALARTLTYTAATRPEARRILARYPNDPSAVEALRQSLLWDSQNPSSSDDLRAFLAQHPDPQLAQTLKADPPQSHPAPAAPHAPTRESTRSADEQAAYQDLHIGRIGEAEQRFKAILEHHPADAAALAGMGYIRMQQGNFGGAISFLTQARQDGSEDPGLDAALDTSRFWYTLGAGQAALAENDLASAEKQFQTALALRPTSSDALDGLGATLLKARKPEAAARLYERFTVAQPNAPAAWRGLFLAQAASGNASGNPSAALVIDRRIPPVVHAQLLRDPRFIEALAAAYAANGQDVEAQRTLQAALDLPVPSGGAALLQYAGLLQQANRLDQAEALYRQILVADPASTPAWIGLIRVQHAAGHDAEAMQTLENLPPAVYAAASRDEAFDATMADLFESAGKLDTAQDVLEKLLVRQAAAGEAPSVPLRIQLAAVYLRRNRPQLAYPLYQRVLADHPDDRDAWNGLLSTLHATGRDRDALSQVQQLPPAVRLRLETDPAYLQTVAAVYNALGQPAQAAVFLGRLQQVYSARSSTPPAEIELQNAGLLLAAQDDAALYAQLLALAARNDLTPAQRRTLDAQWAAWALRRAGQAVAAGNAPQALAILDAAAAAFPSDPAVLDVLAPAFASAGQPQRAVALFQLQDMAHASLNVYLAAIAAANAASDPHDAQTWLHQGLAAFPSDPNLLLIAARAEQSRGAGRHAVELYRRSLAAMPSAVPEPPGQTRIPNQSQSQSRLQDLARLLAPNTPPNTLENPPRGSLLSPAPPAPVVLPTPSPSPAPTPSTPISLNTPPTTQLRLRNASTPPQMSARTLADTTYGPYIPYNPAQPRTGQSHPPGDDLPVTVRNAFFSPQSTPDSPSAPQIPRPAHPPSPQPGDSDAQQYPRPRRSPRRTVPTAGAAQIQSPTPAPSAPPALASQPLAFRAPTDVPATPQASLPALTYPSFAQPITSQPSSVIPAARPATRQAAELELASLEATYTSSLAATGIAAFRSGTAGLDRLTALESPVEFSAVLALNVRAAILPRPVFLNSGTLDPTAFAAHSGPIPILGTLPANAASAPAQQIANGLGGELQLVSASFALAAGYTPYEFLVHNLTARLRFRPALGPFTLFAEREPVRQTQLSYAGLRDPGSPFPGNIWGGVIASGAGLRLDLGPTRSHLILTAHGAALTGRHVLDNTAFHASAEARFGLQSWPRVGTLSLAPTLTASHFAHDEHGLSFGQGGYFSPNVLVQASVPIAFSGHAARTFHYRVSAAPGVHTFQTRPAPLYPLDPTLQSAALSACTPSTIAARTCAFYPATAQTAAAYSVAASAAYQIAAHWYLGAFVSADNTNFFNTVSSGFYLRFLFAPQIPLEDDGPTGLPPAGTFVPLRIP